MLTPPLFDVLVGWQIAVMAAEPGKLGVTAEPAAGIVMGLVETNSSGRLVMGWPIVSVTVTTRFCVVFWFTDTGVVGAVVDPGMLSVMVLGGQVEKKPTELEACEIAALMSVEPGWAAVARPFWSMVTMLPLVAEKVSGPTWQLMLFLFASKLCAASCANWPCETQLVPS